MPHGRRSPKLVEKLQTRFGDILLECKLDNGEVTIEVPPERLIEVFTALRDEPDFVFEQVMDICGVDYQAYGAVEWATGESSNKGFSRGVVERATGRAAAAIQHVVADRRFAGRGALPPSTNCCRCRATSGAHAYSRRMTNCQWYPRWWRCGRRPTGTSARHSICTASFSKVTRTCGAF